MSELEQKSLEVARKLFAEGKSSAEALAALKKMFEEDQKTQDQAAYNVRPMTRSRT